MKQVLIRQMPKNYLFIILVLTVSLIFSACDEDLNININTNTEDLEIPNEVELITSLNYSLVPKDGSATVILTFIDLDEGVAPTIIGGTLAANQTYLGTLKLLNESITPLEIITVEVEEEDEDHQFFFQSTISDITSNYNDQDANGNPLGINSTLITGATASGTLTIILRHKPDKFASGVSGGDITNAGGETDIEVTFPINIQ